MKMRIIAYFVLIIVIIAHGNGRAEESRPSDPDSVFTFTTKSKLIIKEGKDNSVITVTEKDDNKTVLVDMTIDFPSNSDIRSRQKYDENIFQRLRNGKLYESSKTKNGISMDFIIDGVCIGLSKTVGYTGGIEPFQWNKSLEIGWLNAFAISYGSKYLSFSFGIGFDWRNYKTTTSDNYLSSNTSGGIDISVRSSDDKVVNSRIKVFSMQFPLLLRGRIRKTSLRYKIGPILCMNTYGSVKTIFINSEGKKYKEFAKDIALNKLTADIFGSISFKNDIGIYVRYSPLDVMKKGVGINFSPFTVGVGIGI